MARDPRRGGPSPPRRTARRGRDEPSSSSSIPSPKARRDRGAPRPRRFEPFPRWGYVLLGVTAVVVPLASHIVFRDHLSAGGTSCGSALFPTAHDGDAVAISACTQVTADARPLAVAAGAVAVVLVMISITTLTVRGWVRREAWTPD